ENMTKCYPLDYVIHHHIVNDQFDSKTVALTYCAMCRSILPFDVTEIGPLFVAALKNANMIVADRRTKTFFQQGTFQSIIGKLHPTELTMIPFQILTWAEVKQTIGTPQVVEVKDRDFRDFQLPIPGVWKRIMRSEFTPGLSAKNRDKSFPARTHVIGVIDASIQEQVVYLKREVLKNELVVNTEQGFFLFGRKDKVVAFKNTLNTSTLAPSIHAAEIVDSNSHTRWNIRGKYLSGPLKGDLTVVALSDEYWFSWRRFHENAHLIRL
ncbi:MAG: DUF3179 domain-containing (seleno)protein, partial [Bacteroidota bacterium]